MLVYIFACEGSYSRLHRMYEEDVIEVKDTKEAKNYGYEMAEGVVESYNCFDEDEDIEQELEWRVYKIKEGISIEEARAALGSHDEEGFVAEYCEGEVLN